MTKYHIIQKYTFNELTEAGGAVTSASPAIDWAIGLPFDWVRAHCEKKGWRIVPIIDRELDFNTYGVDGDEYVIHHDGTDIRRITKNGKEIPWQQLPSILKGLL